MSAPQAEPSLDIVLAHVPERARIEEIQRKLGERRDEIAALDLEIETLREQLLAFEALYRARLSTENGTLEAIQSLVAHLDRWTELLEGKRPLAAGAKRVEQRRQRDVRKQARKETPVDVPPTLPPPTPEETQTQLKSVYRALARRYHPDLARTEEERVRFGRLMSQINALYHERNLERLLVLQEQAKGGEPDADTEGLEEQLQSLEERLIWFDRVVANLREERAELERNPTCSLLRNVEQAQTQGRDLLTELKDELQARVEKAYQDIPSAVRRLETQVSRYNRQSVTSTLQEVRGSKSPLEKIFDPYSSKRVVRLGLEALSALSVNAKARTEANTLEALATEKPALLRLVLFTYVSELSPFPFTGLERYEDLALRFAHLGEKAPTLEEALVEATPWLEYGVRRASQSVAHTGLRFRDSTVRDAVPVALRAQSVRRELKRVLETLGEHARCSACQAQVFAIPLYRTRGLDDMRASVCPECGHAIKSYWMPKGKDVQSVLNDAFLDLEVVTEWSFRLSRGTVALQLLPSQVDEMSVGDLKKRLLAEVFDRNGIELKKNHLKLMQGARAVEERTPLGELDEMSFTVKLSPEAKLSPADALERVRHRIRQRFRPS